MHWLEFWGLRVNGFESADALAEALFNTAPERRPALVVLGLMPKHLDTAVITDLLRRDRGTTALLVLIYSVSPSLPDRIRSGGHTLGHPKSVTIRTPYSARTRHLQSGPTGCT